MTSGGRNLVILGLASAVIAMATTGVSLMVYHNSGDIYLDRSRPGYLPDKEEIEQGGDKKDEFVFDKTGTITGEVLDQYLENLQKEIDAIDAYKDPFDMTVLSDEKLGIAEE